MNKHKFNKINKITAICAYCGQRASYDGWNLKKIRYYFCRTYNIKKIKKYHKSSYKLTNYNNVFRNIISGKAMIRQKECLYYINPLTGKKLYKLDCKYNGIERMINEII